MSSVPQRESQPERRSAPQTDLMVQALQREAQAWVDAEEARDRIHVALQQRADTFDFTWLTADDHEATLRVYYVSVEEMEYVACELTCLDGRSPTVQERNRLEAAFNAEMDAAGDLLERVAGTLYDGNSV